MAGIFICGWLGERVNWHYGFAAAGVGIGRQHAVDHHLVLSERTRGLIRSDRAAAAAEGDDAILRPGLRPAWAIQNAELWVRDYRLDGLRLDAVHAVRDDSPHHVLAEHNPFGLWVSVVSRATRTPTE